MAKDNKPDEKPDETPAPFDDEEFFKSEGITEDEEKEAIRSRARVSRYVNWRTQKEADSKDPKKNKGAKKPWYKE